MNTSAEYNEIPHAGPPNSVAFPSYSCLRVPYRESFGARTLLVEDFQVPPAEDGTHRIWEIGKQALV